jgi:hypothetical protein
MREHQIVITLKPEQFAEIQRLSREAGAKSMGMFVRQKLVEILDLEGAAGAGVNVSIKRNLKQVATGLKRLHGELKVFVSEPLTMVDGAEIIPAETKPAPEKIVAAKPSPVTPEKREPQRKFNPDKDPLEELLKDADLSALSQQATGFKRLRDAQMGLKEEIIDIVLPINGPDDEQLSPDQGPAAPPAATPIESSPPLMPRDLPFSGGPPPRRRK